MDSRLLWKDEYCLGHGVIDSEHKNLFDIANYILAVNNPRMNSDEIRERIHELYDYIEDHFEHEERFMSEISYPEIEHHKEKHREIIEEMNKMLDINEGFNVLEINLVYIMQKWLLEHILEEDMKMMKIIGSHELKAYYSYCRPGLHNQS